MPGEPRCVENGMPFRVTRGELSIVLDVAHPYTTDPFSPEFQCGGRLGVRLECANIPCICFRSWGIGVLRTAFVTMTVLIGLVGLGGESLAQSNRGYPTQPNLPVPPIEGEDVVGPGGGRPGSEGLGQFDSRLTGLTRRDFRPGHPTPERYGRRSAPRRSFRASFVAPWSITTQGARRYDYRGYTEHAPLFDAR